MINRDELVELRKATLARVEKLRRLGDHSAEAPDIRANAECILILIEDRLEQEFEEKPRRK